MKSLGMNYKFAVCAQPLKGEIFTVKSFLRQMQQMKIHRHRKSRKKFMNSSKFQSANFTFKKHEDKAYLCGLQPVSKEELSEQDLQMISKEVLLISEQGEHFGV